MTHNRRKTNQLKKKKRITGIDILRKEDGTVASTEEEKQILCNPTIGCIKRFHKIP